jgi:hypothetical protein
MLAAVIAVFSTGQNATTKHGYLSTPAEPVCVAARRVLEEL